MTPVSLAFLWHQHQPLYRLREEHLCLLPFVRLHGIRSYYDMVRVLEEFPDVRVTINLVPTLIEQIRAYERGGSDVFWETGAVPAEDLDEAQRVFLFDHFFAAQEAHMIGALPRFVSLLERRQSARRRRGPADAWREFSTADFRDLQALFDLAWFGFKAREDFPALQALRRRGQAYTQENIREIHAIEREVLQRLIPLHREAAARGQVEISTSPYAHPILPLILDTQCAREARPEAVLPARFPAPEDATAQVVEALDFVERELGVRPRGLWPSEGAVSQAALEAIAAAGLVWTASDQEVLRRSDRDGEPDPYRPWVAEGRAAGPALLFRDRDLSDRIGFDYARADPEAATESLLAEVLRRAGRPAPEGSMLLLALDGENPWEHYPRAGAGFVRALYGGLSRRREVDCRPLAEAVSGCAARGRIRRLHAGSWIRADLATWIGGPEKNRAWTLLGAARADLAGRLADPATPAAARREAWASIRAAEGSDWFWWLDDQYDSAYRAQFDQLFRAHLRQAYEALGRAVPDALAWPVRSPQRRPGDEGTAAEAASWLDPRIDGLEGDYFEWQGSVRLSWSALHPVTTMQRGARPVEALRFGFSRAGDFFLRLDPAPEAPRPAFSGLGLDLSFRASERTSRLCLEFDERGDLRRARLHPDPPGPGDGAPSRARAAARKILELAVPSQEVGLAAGERAGLLVRLRRGEEGLALREIALRVPPFVPDAARRREP